MKWDDYHGQGEADATAYWNAHPNGYTVVLNLRLAVQNGESYGARLGQKQIAALSHDHGDRPGEFDPEVPNPFIEGPVV